MPAHSIPPIPWSKSVWFFDLDDTLVDTAGITATASDGIRDVFAARYGAEKGAEVQQQYNRVFQIMMAGYRVKSDADWAHVPGGQAAFRAIFAQVEGCQVEVVRRYGAAKKFSREVFIKIAADQAGVPASPELIDAAACAHWDRMTKQAVVFPPVLALFAEIKRRARPIYLVTSSDARLTLRADGQFVYDPAYSEAFKRARIEPLREKGLAFNGVSIGDPEDKPHLDFFQKAIALAQAGTRHPLDLQYAIMVGDSFAADLRTPKEQLGFGLVVLFQKNRPAPEVVDAHQLVTGNVLDTTQYLAE